MGTFFTDTWEALVSYVPNLLFALLVLIAGWVIALMPGIGIARASALDRDTSQSSYFPFRLE